MKRVSFNAAKSLKEIGYPQLFIELAYYEDKKLHHVEDPYNNCKTIIAYAPTYIEVWLWLWRTKQIELSFDYAQRCNDIDEKLLCLPLRYHEKSHPNMKYLIQEINRSSECCSHGYIYEHKHADPEEVITNTIFWNKLCIIKKYVHLFSYIVFPRQI